MCARYFTTLCVAAAFVAGLVTAGYAESLQGELVGGPYKVIAADFTGNQIIDLCVAYYPIGVVTVEQVDGKGQFSRLSLNTIRVEDSDAALPGGGESVFNIAHGDIDNDGLADLVVGLGRFVSVGKNLGDGRFKTMLGYRTESEAKGVRLADLDNDGRLDLLYTARGTGRKGDTRIGKLSIRRGLGDWRFGPALDLDAGISAYYVETADLNNDGFLDILVPNELGSTVSYWMNPGRDIFRSGEILTRHVLQTSGERINDVRAADFDGDGNLDLVTANWASSTISVFLGNGDSSFQNESLYDGGMHCVFFSVGDLDHDGDLDFVVTHWTEDFLSVFLNQGEGLFSPRVDYKTGLGNYGVALCDMDGDGNLDAVTANYRERSLSLLKGAGDGTFHAAVTTPRALRLQDGNWVEEDQ